MIQYQSVYCIEEYVGTMYVESIVATLAWKYNVYTSKVAIVHRTIGFCKLAYYLA